MLVFGSVEVGGKENSLKDKHRSEPEPAHVDLQLHGSFYLLSKLCVSMVFSRKQTEEEHVL